MQRMTTNKKYEVAYYHCPSCNRSTGDIQYEFETHSNIIKIYHCDACGLKFARPIVLEDLSERQMDSVEDAELFDNKLLKKLHEHLIVKKEIRKVRTILGRKSFSMLDIGCGTGWTSSIWKKAGIDVTGLEPSPQRGKIAREKYDLRIIPAFVEDMPMSERFDVIVMRHVLEHMAEPRKILEKLSGHLRDGGLIVLVVPNINCIGRYLFGTNWTWVLPWHCSFFSPRSLKTLAELSGFRKVQSYQAPSPLWYPESFLRLFPSWKSARSWVYGRLSIAALMPFAPLVLFGYLVGLSDNITLIAQKNMK